MRCRTLARFILLLSALLLSGCGKKAPKVEKVVEVEEAPPSILSTNFAIGSIVEALVDGESIKLFNPVRAGKDPMEFTPSLTDIDRINRTRPLIFVAGEKPSWLSSIEQPVKVVNVLADRSETFEGAANPTQALEVQGKIGTEIAVAFPEVSFRSDAPDFHEKLANYKRKWDELGAGGLSSEGLESGEIRPYKEKDFLELVDDNFQLLKGKLQEQHALLTTFEGGIAPILEDTCLKCHDEESQEGDLNFELYLTEEEAVLQPELWERVAKVVEMGQMPPPKKRDQLSDDEKERIYAWKDSLLEKWDSGEMGADPGKTTIHRINKNEYNYTIRDLFGLKIRPADSFPEEGGGEGGFDNNADALYLPPLLVENYFESASLIVEAVYADRSALSRYLITRPSHRLEPEQAAEAVIKYWASLIYRKPANDEEVARLVEVFRVENEQNKRFDEAMKMPLLAMLISPNFLYRSTLTEEQAEPYPIDDFELASRLSYFLWSSMPDPELFQLAVKGELKDPAVLEAQVKRMLLDEKSNSLGMHLGGQWFGWELLRSSANPDIEKYPEFTFQLRVQLYQESMMFFNDLVKNNGSIYNFLDSDYTFLNETLASFYKIPGVTGDELRRVELIDKNRGGVLGMGSVLTATSLPLRSSPSIRGAFVLKDILGTTLPEPPMNVEQLPADDREIKGATFRETLEQHRSDADCRSCHAMIDPIGFGLESFDAIGRFRTEQNGIPIDTEGVMPDGTNVSSLANLKRALLEQKEEFARNTVEKLLTYALGRDLTPYDRPVVADITEKVVADQGSVHTAFVEVVKSYPFTHRRGDSYEAGEDYETADDPEPVKKRRRRAKRNK